MHTHCLLQRAIHKVLTQNTIILRLFTKGKGLIAACVMPLICIEVLCTGTKRTSTQKGSLYTKMFLQKILKSALGSHCPGSSVTTPLTTDLFCIVMTPFAMNLFCNAMFGLFTIAAHNTTCPRRKNIFSNFQPRPQNWNK